AEVADHAVFTLLRPLVAKQFPKLLKSDTTPKVKHQYMQAPEKLGTSTMQARPTLPTVRVGINHRLITDT
ncbi:MAG: hypothetical protein ACK55I_07480, partial [bacterium]